MKKLFIAASLVVASFAVNAQDEPSFTSKNGHEVLPQAGDYGISLDAAPILNFVGNAFNGAAGNNASSVDPSSPFTTNGVNITVRKFNTGNTAIRARVGVSLTSFTEKTNVNKVGGTATEFVEDKETTKASSFYISGGLEKRRGSTRVQGIYGAEFVIAVVSDANTKFEYGNPLSAANPGTRTLEEKNGNTLFVGPRGFVGIEYFVAPKISLGGEFGLGLFLQKQGASETTTETWNGTAVETTTTPSTTAGGAGESGLNFTTDNLNASISLNFFF